MILKIAGKNNWISFKSLPILGLGLAFCVGALPAAAQQNQPDQPGEVQGNVASSGFPRSGTAVRFSSSSSRTRRRKDSRTNHRCRNR